MAQAAGILYLDAVPQKSRFLCEADKVKFRKPVVPGDQLELANL